MSINEYIDKFIQNHWLNTSKVKILLAVSGGLDSMVLLHVLSQSEVNFGVATINYKLREKANVETQLVIDFCKKQEIDHHLHICSPEEQKVMKLSNLQEKARKIRYNFFESLIINKGYTHLMTAHHSDDILEGLFLSLNRGSGLRGMSPMQEVSNNLLRPLLRFSKEQLENYSFSHSVPFEEDESNKTNDYDRNYIRNEIIPRLEKRLPSFKKSASQSLEHLSNANQLLQHFIKNAKNELVSMTNDEVVIKDISKIKNTPGSKTLLYSLISPYGFNSNHCQEILESQSTGALWNTQEYRAIIQSNDLIINKVDENSNPFQLIEGEGKHELARGTHLEIKRVKKVLFEKSKNIEYIDGQLIKFPLTLRSWRPGDRMYPYGMNGQSKKIKDILTGAKINRLDKEKCMVLCSDDKIVWLVNIRLDDRFKVSKHSKSFLKLHYKA